jgi:hypothetical protein
MRFSLVTETFGKAEAPGQTTEGGLIREGCMEEDLDSKRQPNPLPSAECIKPSLQQCCNDAPTDAAKQQGVQESDRECSDAPPVAPAHQQEAQNKTQTDVCVAKTIKISKKTKTNQIQDGGENHLKIPQELKASLEELSIPLDNRVRNAIATHHLSQVKGAIAHIENTWESISNPRGVFLFQIGKQPIEPIGSRGREYKASDFESYSLDYLKFMYPNRWRDAAIHFGIDVSQEQSNNSQLQTNL